MLGIIFARESNRYDKTDYSLESQVEACELAAKAEGVNVPEKNVFREKFSGRDLSKMPKLGELRRLLQTAPGRKKIYCYAQDRLFRGRRGYHIFRVLSEFDEWNTDVYFILDNVDTSCFAGQLQVLFKGEKAAREPDDILDRTMRGKVKRIREGKIPGFGRDKYGYTKNNGTGKASINEAEAAVLRRIRDGLFAGESISGMARKLTAEGIPTPGAARGMKSTRWWPSTICTIFRDPAYKGEGAALRRVSVDGRVQPRPANGWIKLPADCYPPIITPAEWQRLQDLFDKNKGAHTRNQKRPALLRGLIFCAVCGRPFYLANNQSRGRTNLYYRCATITDRRSRPDQPRCPVKQIAAKWIEEAVWEGVVEVVSNPVKLRAMLTESAQAGDEGEIEAELKGLRADLAKKDSQQQNLGRELRDATITAARVIKAELEKIESEREALLAREAELLRRRLTAGQRLQRIDEIEALVRKSAKKMPRAKFEEKRMILEGIGARVTVNGRDFKVAISIS